MDKKNIILFGLLVIAGIILRVLYVNDALWYDEACSWVIAKSGGVFDYLIHNDLQHTPLYFILLKLWIKMFGQEEIALRSLSLIFGVGIIPLGYVVAKKILSEKIKYIAMALLTLSPILTIFSVEVRMYSLVCFLVLLSVNYLIDFEQTKKISSLIKLGIVNILIPYTFVGAIFYNLSLISGYMIYLIKNNKDQVKLYLKEVIIEICALIPYFILIGFYAYQRAHFVITHESKMYFFNIIDVIRNFFGTSIVPNVYWPSDLPYNLTFWFCISVVVPCIYFIMGFLHNYKTTDRFSKTLCNIFLICFVLFILTSMLSVNVCTVRYILYILPMFFILSIRGLWEKLSDKHFYVFISLFLIFCLIFDVKFAPDFYYMKKNAFQLVRIESDKLNLNADDIIIMPFGSDAPYYFRDLTSPRVLEFDFHKQARNPKNKLFYGETNIMETDKKYDFIYKKVFEDKVISENYFEYFLSNVNATVPKGRYVLLALYGSDANYMVNIETFRNQIKNVSYIKTNILDVLFKKYLLDLRALLNYSFNVVQVEKDGNYTFILFQKK